MNVHDSTSRAHGSVCVKISHEQVDWDVSIPARLCKQESASVEQVMQLVFQAGPVSVQGQGLQPFTFNKSPWTHDNLEALLHDRRIILAHDAASIPKVRSQEWQILPDTRIYTEPQDMPAQDDQLPAVYTYASEYVENGSRAVRSNLKGPKQIDALFHLPSVCDGLTEDAQQDFIAFGDNGCGMDVNTLLDFCKLAGIPYEYRAGEDLRANVRYFMDGTYHMFGVGGKHAAFLYGMRLLVLTCALDVDGKSEILEVRLDKEAMVQQEGSAAGPYRFKVTARQPNVRDTRTPAELRNPQLMSCIDKFDAQKSGSLFIITGLNSQRMSELKARSFQVLCKYLSGTYFYMCAPGHQPASDAGPAVDSRANFMHGSYKYGPVELTVTGVGFRKEGLDGIDPALTQTLRIGDKPWSNWPGPPEEDDQVGPAREDVMHILARVMTRSCFNRQTFPDTSPVHGSKFVFGILVGKQFLLVYLHYLPVLEGKETKPLLGLRPGVRWIATRKGKVMQYAEPTAMLPIMKKCFPASWKPQEPSQAPLYRKIMQERIVGQLILPGVTGVDRFKNHFLEPMNDRLANLPDDCYFNVSEDILFSDKVRYEQEVYPRTPYGPDIRGVRSGVLQTELTNWVVKSRETHDDEWEFEEPDQANSLDGFTVYKTLRKKQHNERFTAGELVVVSHLGGPKLSRYRRSAGSGVVENTTKLLGCIQYFKRPNGSSICDGKAVLTRQPTQAYGSETFDVSIYKLKRIQGAAAEKEKAEAIACMPHTLHIESEGRQRMSNDRTIQHVAGSDLPRIRVDVSNSKPESNRPGHRITGWTAANDGNHAAVEALKVRLRIVYADGPDANREAVCQEAECLQIDGEHCFIFGKRHKLQLPRPGKYHTEFTATFLNRDPAFSQTIRESFTYEGVLGNLDACTIKGVPTEPQRLGTPLTDLYVELWDQHQNSWFNRLVPKVTFTSSKNKLSLSSQAGMWETTDAGQHRLRLPTLTVIPDKLPADAFATNSGSASVSCTVNFTENVSDSFTLAILPGLPQKMLLSPTPAWFTTTNAVPTQQLENHESSPAFSVQLYDAWGFKATPLALQDSVGLQIEGEGEAVSNNNAMLHQTRGTARFAAMGLNLANMQQARTVQFTAELVSVATHNIAPLTFRASIQPSSKPTTAQLFWDPELQRPLPSESQGNATKFVLEQVAGQKTQQLYMTLHTEDGALKPNPDISSVSLARHLLFEVLASSAVRLNCTDQVKSANSIADVKEAEIQVTGKTNWEIKLQVRLEACCGVPVAWALEFLKRHEETVQNGENISAYVVASLMDELNNRCKLPQGLLSPAPILTVRSAAEHEAASHETTPLGFWNPGNPVSNPAYVGDWLQHDGSDTLQMPKIALVGPPGPVHLTLCAAPGSAISHLRPCVLPLTLTTGAIEQWRHEGLPEGVQPSRVEVGSMTLTPLDAGKNPVELGQGTIRIKITGQGSLQELLQALSLKTARNRDVISARREGSVLHIEPFVLLSSAAGSHNLDLHVQQQASRQWRPIGKIAFTIMTVLSNSIVQAFDIVWPPSPAPSVAAGSEVPWIRFKGTAEDGSQCAAAQLAGAAKVHIKHPNKQAYPLDISCDPADSTIAVCNVSEENFLKMKGTYQVVVESVQQTTPASSASSSFVVTAGPRHHLHLQTSVLEDRRCFNAGTEAQRTVFNSGVLSIRDIFDNIVTEAESPSSMSAAVSALSCAEGSTNTLQLNLSQVLIPLSTGTVTIGRVVVNETQEPVEGLHQIQIRLNSSSEQECVPVHLPFSLIEASTMTQAVKDALAALHQAEEQKCDAERHASTVTRQLRGAQCTREQCLQATRSTLPDVTDFNRQEQFQVCEQHKSGVRVARVARHYHTMPAADLAELTSMDGVLGFISDLVFVEDDSDARLLSWHSRHALDLLVVTTVAAVNAVDARFPNFKPQKLLLNLVDRPSENQSLPHNGVVLPSDLQVDVTIFATRVTVFVPEARLASGREDAEKKILQHVCGRLLRMHRELDAIRYMDHIKNRMHRHCPSILCIDDGALVSTSGVVGGKGDTYRAPTLTPSHPCYGQVAAQLTTEYKFWQQATQQLQLLDQVLLQLEQFQEHHADAQSRKARADADEQQCRAAWKQAQREAEQLQLDNLSHLTTHANQRSNATARTGRKRGRQSSDNEHTKGKPSLFTPARPATRQRPNAEHDT